MNKQTLELNSPQSIQSSRSISSSIIQPQKRSRIMIKLSEDSKSLSSIKKPTFDYLSLYTPKREPESVVKPEPREQIIESYQIKELLSAQEGRRKKLVEKWQDSSMLVKMISDFRITESKIVREKSKEKLLEVENCAVNVVVKMTEKEKDFMKMQNEFDDLKEEHKRVLSNMALLERELRELKERQSSINKKSADSNYIIDKIEKNHIYEKAQLENQIDLLKTQLDANNQRDKPQKEEKKEPRWQDYEELYKNIKQKFEKSQISYTKIQFTLGKTKEKAALLQNIVDSYQDVKGALENEIEALKDRNQLLTSSLNAATEKILMEHEEILANMNTHLEIKRLRGEKAMVQNKLNQLEVGILSGSISNHLSEEFVSTTDPIFQLILNPDKYKSRNVRRDSKISYLDPNSINLNSLKPCRPSFASLLKIPTGHVQYNPPNQDWLFVTIRSIFDSKYNEHLLCAQDDSVPSSFPEFVYDWLGNFYVENASRTVKQLEWWSRGNADEIRLQLLAGLSLARSKKVWELNTFREFLLEELDLDELVFYLHCRYLLFGGPQMSHSAGKYTAMHYITLPQAKDLIRLVMEGLTSDAMSQLIYLVENKATKKPGNVESSFILRTLLEYYHREKKLKFIAIQELFYRSSKTDFTFESFKDICLSLDSTLSSYIIAKAYREAYMEGNGFISPEVFYIVANNMLFYYMLRLKSPWKIPKLNEFGEIDGTFNTYSEYMAQVDAVYKSHKKDIEVATKFIESMGIPDFFRHITRLENALNRKYQNLESLKHWNLADVFKQFWLSVFRAKSVFYESNGMNPLIVKNKLPEIREKELKETVNANLLFLEDIYNMNLEIIAAKILLRRIQRRARNRGKGLDALKRIVHTVNSFKKTVSKVTNKGS